MARIGGSSQIVDAATDATLVINYDHHEIHGGSHYFVQGWQDVTNAATVVDFLFVTPNTTKWAHALWKISAEDEFTFALYEGTVTTDDGSGITIYNSNRNSSNTAGITAYSGPTVDTAGTLLLTDVVGSSRTIGSSSRNHELIAKQNTKYLFRITKVNAGTHWLAYEFRWYEHTHRR